MIKHFTLELGNFICPIKVFVNLGFWVKNYFESSKLLKPNFVRLDVIFDERVIYHIIMFFFEEERRTAFGCCQTFDKDLAHIEVFFLRARIIRSKNKLLGAILIDFLNLIDLNAQQSNKL